MFYLGNPVYPGDKSVAEQLYLSQEAITPEDESIIDTIEWSPLGPTLKYFFFVSVAYNTNHKRIHIAWYNYSFIPTINHIYIIIATIEISNLIWYRNNDSL